MFKRNQVEEAIACVLEPGSAKPSSEMRTRLRRLLETDRALGRSKRSPDPERANFAFSGMDAFTAYAEQGSWGLDPAYGYGGIHGRRSDGAVIALDNIDQFAAEMDDFARCIMTNQPTRVPGEEGLRDIKIMMAIYEAARTGREIKLT